MHCPHGICICVYALPLFGLSNLIGPPMAGLYAVSGYPQAMVYRRNPPRMMCDGELIRRVFRRVLANLRPCRRPEMCRRAIVFSPCQEGAGIIPRPRYTPLLGGWTSAILMLLVQLTALAAVSYCRRHLVVQSDPGCAAVAVMLSDGISQPVASVWALVSPGVAPGGFPRLLGAAGCAPAAPGRFPISSRGRILLRMRLEQSVISSWLGVILPVTWSTVASCQISKWCGACAIGSSFFSSLIALLSAASTSWSLWAVNGWM